MGYRKMSGFSLDFTAPLWLFKTGVFEVYGKHGVHRRGNALSSRHSTLVEPTSTGVHSIWDAFWRDEFLRVCYSPRLLQESIGCLSHVH